MKYAQQCHSQHIFYSLKTQKEKNGDLMNLFITRNKVGKDSSLETKKIDTQDVLRSFVRRFKVNKINDVIILTGPHDWTHSIHCMLDCAR